MYIILLCYYLNYFHALYAYMITFTFKFMYKKKKKIKVLFFFFFTNNYLIKFVIFTKLKLLIKLNLNVSGIKQLCSGGNGYHEYPLEQFPVIINQMYLKFFV